MNSKVTSNTRFGTNRRELTSDSLLGVDASIALHDINHDFFSNITSKKKSIDLLIKNIDTHLSSSPQQIV